MSEIDVMVVTRELWDLNRSSGLVMGILSQQSHAVSRIQAYRTKIPGLLHILNSGRCSQHLLLEIKGRFVPDFWKFLNQAWREDLRQIQGLTVARAVEDEWTEASEEMGESDMESDEDSAAA